MTAASESVQHVTRQTPPWPPHAEATYMLSRFECACGWIGETFRGLRDPLWREVRDRAREAALRHEGQNGTPESAQDDLQQHAEQADQAEVDAHAPFIHADWTRP